MEFNVPTSVTELSTTLLWLTPSLPQEEEEYDLEAYHSSEEEEEARGPCKPGERARAVLRTRLAAARPSQKEFRHKEYS